LGAFAAPPFGASTAPWDATMWPDDAKCPRGETVGVTRALREIVPPGVTEGLVETTRRPLCAFATNASAIAFGVLTSRPTVARAETIRATWARSADVLYLGGSGVDAIDIAAGDDYHSLYCKGFLGLEALHAARPDAKWYALVDDDTLVNVALLAQLLSAFDPAEEWALGQGGFSKIGKAQVWRLFGGAGLILSKKLLDRVSPMIMPFLESNTRALKRRQARPVEYSFDLLQSKFLSEVGCPHVSIQGLYSQPPAHYLTTALGRSSAPDGLGATPAVFHYVQLAYLTYLHNLFANVKLCAGTTGDASNVAVGYSHLGAHKKAPEGTFALRDVKKSPEALVGYLRQCLERFPGAAWYVVADARTAFVLLDNVAAFLKTKPRADMFVSTCRANEAPILFSNSLALRIVERGLEAFGAGDADALCRGLGEKCFKETRLSVELASSPLQSPVCALVVFFDARAVRESFTFAVNPAKAKMVDFKKLVNERASAEIDAQTQIVQYAVQAMRWRAAAQAR